MPNSFCCYLNSSLKIQVILNGGIFTQTGPRSRSSSPAQLQLLLACFLSLSSDTLMEHEVFRFPHISFQERKLDTRVCIS